MISPMVDQDIGLLEGDLLISRDDSSSNIVQPSYDTLDEPVRVTLMRDLQSVGSKMKYILLPVVSQSEIEKNFLRDWDLWGPLILCTFMVLFLHHLNHEGDNYNKSGPQLSQLFGLIWLGSYVTCFNFKMLSISPNPNHNNQPNQLQQQQQSSSTIIMKKTPCPSLFQLLCVLGYCLSPSCVGLIILTLIEQLTSSPHSISLFTIKLIIGLIICFSWPTLSCYKILNSFQDPEKMILAFYPIALFYFVLTCIIITSH